MCATNPSCASEHRFAARSVPFLIVQAHDYRDLVATYIDRNFGSQGLAVFTEVSLGRTIIGKSRRIDVFVLRERDQMAFAIECKYQKVSGTADEKIPYALQDLEALWIPG